MSVRCHSRRWNACCFVTTGRCISSGRQKPANFGWDLLRYFLFLLYSACRLAPVDEVASLVAHAFMLTYIYMRELLVAASG